MVRFSFARAFVVAIASGLAAASLSEVPAQEKKTAAVEYECRFTHQPPTIDGKADDAVWKNAQIIDRFTLPWLREEERPARTATKARLLWDREHIYFLAEMDDSDLYADVTEHDGMTWNNDVFELFFKPADDKPGYYEFQVNAAGTVLDMFLPRRGAGGYQRFIKDGQFHLQAKVELRGTLNKWTDEDNGWTVEGKLPWRDFLRTGGRPNPGERWKFALCRYDYAVDFEGPELSTCAPLSSQTHADFHHYEDYASLLFVGPERAGRKMPPGLEQRAAVKSSRVIGSPDPPPPFRAVRVFPKLQVNFPVSIVRQPGTDLLLFITQNWPYAPTAIHRIRDQAESSTFETLLTTEDVAYDICFHPRFAENGFLYVGNNGPSKDGRKYSRVTRYTMERAPPYRLDANSAVEIIAWPSDGHNGAAICFGADGMMYVTSGDGTSDSDTNVTGQDMTQLLAKVLRIDVDHPTPDKRYSVPKDNPFVGRDGIVPETWAFGLRNPWRMTCDPRTGHIWVGNNGQDLWEQVFFVRKGDNYGWSIYEGSHPFYPERKLGPAPHVLPAAEHHHSEARSLTGGIVYYGEKYPELRGCYIYGDYSTGKIWGLRHDGQGVVWHKELADTTLQITGFGADSRGEILICDHRGGGQGGFYTLTPTPQQIALPVFPRRLSETGLFRSVKDHVPAEGAIPYSVNSPLWSDGAHKERFLALPGDDDVIEVTTSRGWNFPDRTVLVKSFALEMEQGNPHSRRWIETRLLTRQEGEWVGYSYAWNDEQTDAVLVESKGADKAFAIRVPGTNGNRDAVRMQSWHYPSRAECMVCHSRAANWVLGLTTLQMNRQHDYGGVRMNQLELLEGLGLLRLDWRAETTRAVREELEAAGMSEKEINDALAAAGVTRLQRGASKTTLLCLEPENYPRLADPYDPAQPLQARALSYLHANCAHCHVEAGGGNAQISLEFTTDLGKMKLVDVKPVHHTFGLPEARLVAPGSPERSVLLHRLKHRDKGHMPPLATALVDDAAVTLIREWIAQMPPP